MQVILSVEEKNVQQSVATFFDGLATLNMATVKEVSTADLLILEHGAVWNIDTLDRRLAAIKDMRFKRTNQLDLLKINWLETAFLIKEATGWKIRVLHSTKLEH